MFLCSYSTITKCSGEQGRAKYIFKNIEKKGRKKQIKKINQT